LDGEDHTSTENVSDGNWHTCWTLVDLNATVKMYNDGTEVYSDTSSKGAFSVSRDHYIGTDPRLDIFFHGLLGGLFIFKALPSAAWIKADYNAQTDNLITWGVEEEAVFITAAPIKSTTQITAEVASRIEIVAAPIQSNTQITARVRMFWPHKLNGLASGSIVTLYGRDVDIENVDQINGV
jgi:hypothetical protein